MTGAIAILAVWRFKKVMPTLVAGMAGLRLLQYYFRLKSKRVEHEGTRRKIRRATKENDDKCIERVATSLVVCTRWLCRTAVNFCFVSYLPFTDHLD